MIAGHQINRRGLLLSLLNVLLSPPVIGALCFALLFGFVTTLSLIFSEYSRSTVPKWINVIGDIEMSYAALLMPLRSGGIALAASVVLLLGYLVSGTMLRQRALVLFYFLFFLLGYVVMHSIGYMPVRPWDFRLNLVELSIVLSGTIWSIVWSWLWRHFVTEPNRARSL